MEWNERPSWFDCEHEDSTVKYSLDEERHSIGFVLFCKACQSDAVMIEQVSESQVEQLKETSFRFLRHELDVHREYVKNRVACFSEISEPIEAREWNDFIELSLQMVDINDQLAQACDKELESPISTRCDDKPEKHLITTTTMLMVEFSIMQSMDSHVVYQLAYYMASQNRIMPVDMFWEPKFIFPPQELVYKREA